MTHAPLVLASDGIVMIAMIGGLVIAIISLIGSFVRGTERERLRRQTQREIAAYVAEGSMTPEDGERLMRAANEQPKESHDS